jgi:ring-1,2-phenylacetyl-CoA epoxidase subunit PaaE
MIFEVKDSLLELGVSEDKIRFELFTSPDDDKYKHIEKPPLDIPDISSTIELQVDGKMFTIGLNSRDKSVLDAALSEGADLPYACKGGVCCTCKAKLLEGEVHMEVNYGLEPDEVEKGYILTCQSHPKSDFVKINFDV